MNGKEIKNEIVYHNEEASFIDGLDGDKDVFDDALIGYGERCALGPIAIYDVDKIISIFVEKYEMSYENAVDWYDYDVVGVYMGEHTPLFVNDLRKI